MCVLVECLRNVYQGVCDNEDVFSAVRYVVSGYGGVY